MLEFKKPEKSEEFPQPVEAWKLSDGRLLESKQDADEAQQLLYFREWYEQSEPSVGFQEFNFWLERGTNRQTLLEFLCGIED